MTLTIDDALQSFEVAAGAVERQHPELREIARGARGSAHRIAERFRLDGDQRRADREMAILLLDLAEAAQRHEGVQRQFVSEHEGGPPSRATLERERARRRGMLGIAGVGDEGFGDPVRGALSGALSGATASIVRGTVLRGGNPVVRWILDTFGGPAIDVNLGPLGVVTVSPFGVGNPVRAALVMTTAFLAVAFVAWRIAISYGEERRAA